MMAVNIPLQASLLESSPCAANRLGGPGADELLGALRRIAKGDKLAMVYYKGTTCRLVLHGEDLRRALGPAAEDEAAALVYHCRPDKFEPCYGQTNKARWAP